MLPLYFLVLPLPPSTSPSFPSPTPTPSRVAILRCCPLRPERAGLCDKGFAQVDDVGGCRTRADKRCTTGLVIAVVGETWGTAGTAGRKMRGKRRATLPRDHTDANHTLSRRRDTGEGKFVTPLHIATRAVKSKTCQIARDGEKNKKHSVRGDGKDRA